MHRPTLGLQVRKIPCFRSKRLLCSEKNWSISLYPLNLTTEAPLRTRMVSPTTNCSTSNGGRGYRREHLFAPTQLCTTRIRTSFTFDWLHSFNFLLWQSAPTKGKTARDDMVPGKSSDGILPAFMPKSFLQAERLRVTCHY